MAMKNEYNCVDVGTGNCPCRLATCSACIECAKLQGKDCNQCKWSGVCIYNELSQNQGRVFTVRKEIVAPIVDKIIYDENFIVFVLEVGRSLAQRAKAVGSFVFARCVGASRDFDMPISVLKTDISKGQIHIAVNKSGPKSDDIFKATKAISIRGVYRSGLVGLSRLYEDAGKTVLLAKGIAIAPFYSILERMSRDERNNLYSFIDTEKITLDFMKDYFGKLPVENLYYIDFRKHQSLIETLIRQEKDNRTNFFALASPYYSEIIEDAAGGRVVKPNHANMCCGEGICGACTFVDAFGRTVHSCKSPT
ncbi:MAG: hypothetical protein PHH48_07600 [Eubacteriales bacterium]|nr:hypothetical protein [Eubacteriales bacterium]